MSENPDALERALRAGPLDEARYVPLPISVLDRSPIESESSGRLVHLVPTINPLPLRSGSRGLMALAAAACLVIGIVIGRAVPMPASGPAATTQPLVRPALIAAPLEDGWSRISYSQGASWATWMACAAGSAFECHAVTAVDLGHAQNSGQTGGMAPTTPVRNYWARLHPLTIRGGHLAGAFSLPAVPSNLDVRLVPLEGSDNGPGIPVDAVAADSGVFFDLGSVRPGSYALVVEADPTSPDSELFACGVVVEGS